MAAVPNSSSDLHTSSKAKALVLGAPAVAQWIAKELREQGFEPVLQEELGAPGLAGPAEPGAVEGLKAFLQRFADSAGPIHSTYAHCVHPGISPWAERPELSQVAQELGLSAISASTKVVSLFSNRLNLLGEADRLKIGHLVLSFDPIQGIREIEAFMRSHKKFPFVLKSVRGGSGFGIYVIYSKDDLEKRLSIWLDQLRRNVGEANVFPERYLEGARRIVVPFARFQDGRFKLFSFLDASLQGRFRKLIEFCPVSDLDEPVKKTVEDWSRKLVEQVGYVGVGSLEFMVDGPKVYLLEGLARLNTGFPLWEKVEGTQAVAWQLAALEGFKTFPPCKPEKKWSSALSLRFYAEDPLLQLPQPGWIKELSEQRHWSFPKGEAFLEMGVEAGKDFNPVGDGMLGLLYVGAQDRRQALLMGRGILDELWIAGGLQTNERFLGELLTHPWVKSGMFHCSFTDEEFVPELRPSPELRSLFAEVCTSLATVDADQVRWVVGDQWADRKPALLKWVHPPVRDQQGLTGLLELEEGRQVRVCAFRLSDRKWLVRIGHWVQTVRHVLPKAVAISSDEVAGKSAQKLAESPTIKQLNALVTGKVHSILFREGARVPAHEPILIMDSLRVLVPHAFPVPVKIVKWHISSGQRVNIGEDLATFEVIIEKQKTQ